VTTPVPWINEAELQAHLDGELDAELCAAVEAFLAAHPEEAARVRSLRRQTRLIGRAYGPLLERPLPPRMAAAVLAPARQAGGRWWRLAAAAAVALLLFAGGTGSGWWLREQSILAPPEAGLVADAVSAHLLYTAEVRHPVEVGADEQDHLVTWLSRRLGLPLAAPSLAREGFELVGGRLLPAAHGPAAQLMYQDASGRRLTLYVRPSTDPAAETAFRFAREGQLTALYWRDQGGAWALLGELPREDLLRVAHQIYQALQR
jgi:anti-sigma factor RsiW